MSPIVLIVLAVVGITAVILLGLVIYAIWIQWNVQRSVPPRGAFVPVSTGKLHYLSCGNGPEIVMIHGLGGQMGNFDTGLADNLARDHRVTLIDRPGMGYSERPASTPTNIMAQADQMMEIIKALGIERPLIVGHSLGGAIALGMALRHGSKLRGLALLAPLTMPVEEASEAFAGLAIRSDILRRFVGWTFAVPTMIRRPEPVEELIFGPDPVPDTYAIRGGGLLGLRPRHFIQASRDFVNTADDLPSMAREYPRLTLPVRILFGREDRILDPEHHGADLVTRVPQIGLELIDGGHMIPVTRPETCATFIRRASQAMT
ncbi:alpha/beta fold hydrolase [Pseudooceanicola sp. 216_PA32_1]|uniref:Alpha/beta fold hydrolase n=1 Tax=Pseudooceanicola pacificus TaxID=2676438 RepID=A0A844WDZ0_9RHOB|nr:alpha/beta hydrolase [Pseudooceanicola pacificus]MWB77109.1 alpha/beta fold hydrolase [Pseudooceanicola pacificus]